MIYKATLSELHTLVALYFPEIKDELIDLGLSEDEPEHISVCVTENKKGKTQLNDLTIWCSHTIYQLAWHSSFSTGKHYLHGTTRLPDKTEAPVPQKYLKGEQNV